MCHTAPLTTQVLKSAVGGVLFIDEAYSPVSYTHLDVYKRQREYIEAGKDQQGKGFDPRKLLAPGAEAIKNTVKEKMELFGSVGKA